jgi:hypothetical protein
MIFFYVGGGYTYVWKMTWKKTVSKALLYTEVIQLKGGEDISFIFLKASKHLVEFREME